jgi:hypothetical protein
MFSLRRRFGVLVQSVKLIVTTVTAPVCCDVAPAHLLCCDHVMSQLISSVVACFGFETAPL